MRDFLTKLAACLLPLALTPIFGFLISEGFLNLGGGCKDIVVLIPWIVWSLIYSFAFVVFWIKKYVLRRLVLYSVGSATVVMAALWLALLFVSLAWAEQA